MAIKVKIDLSNDRLNVVNTIWQYCHLHADSKQKQLFNNIWGLLADKLSTLAIRKRQLPPNKRYTLKLQYWEAYYLQLALLHGIKFIPNLYEQTVLQNISNELDKELA
ncbi:hypothetical protein [Croceivirga sp. JEA036]|uniref:hypothetical protein n=1 Tax=Croceivirga sp. JEA036 TaxID=2721162 RepID=UPI00143A2F7B|nr:hypothetical protein [Croceivirga sp. JEA036]NJB36369.1 hypothetical protein [Croceivirga sp. JEA036]